MTRRGLRGAGGFNLLRATLALLVLSAALVPPVAFADGPSLTIAIQAPRDGDGYDYTNPAVYFSSLESDDHCYPSSFDWRVRDEGGAVVLTSSYPGFDAPLGIGRYVATLTAVGSCGVTASATSSFYVANDAPAPYYVADAPLVAGRPGTLDASGSYDDGGIVAFDWTVDGVAAGHGATLPVNFTQAGGHHVVLVATDAFGLTGAYDNYVVVSPGPLVAFAIQPGWRDDFPVNTTVPAWATGLDPYGNEIYGQAYALAASCGKLENGSWFVGTLAQDCTLTASFGDVSTARTYHLTAGFPASTAITGPDVEVAGEPITFHWVSYDAFGNVAGSGDSTYTFTTARSDLRYCNGDTCHPFTVVPAALATISLSGPLGQNVVAAGQAVTLRAWGLDAYGNTVFNDGFAWTAPTLAGTATATYARDGVTGALGVQVVPDAATVFRLDGPDTMQAGASTSYAVVLLDPYANPVPASPSTWVARLTAAGAQTIHARVYAQGAYHDLARDVTVTPGPLASLAVTPERSPVNLGRPVQFHVQGADAFGNPVATGPVSWDWSYGGSVNATGVFVGTEAGTQAVHAQAGGVGAYGFVGVRDVFPVSIVMDAGKPALGHGPTGTLAARYLDGAPAANATVTLTFIRGAPLLPPQTFTGTTDASGALRFELPADASLVGGWTVRAHVDDGKNHGDAAASG